MTLTTLRQSSTTSLAIPAISITAPTPPRPTEALVHHTPPSTTKKTVVATTASLTPSYRLLYRGALSLPDSYLLLDGLTFAARLDSPSKSSAFALLENPLALALESMRGRPSLRFLGTVNLRDVYMDESGGVELDIHPNGFLTRIYFENMFCLLPFPSSSKCVAERSEIGVKIALGDSDEGGTTEIVIFAQVIPSDIGGSGTIKLAVARLTLKPPDSVKKRVPRPDDVLPRKPPPHFIRELKRAGSFNGLPGRELKRVASGSIVAVGPAKRQKLVNGSGVLVDLGSDVRLGAVGPDMDKVFKVPDLPKQTKTKGKGKEDVFGDVTEVRGKLKADEVQGHSGDEAALEKANKATIKKATIDYLRRTKDPTTGQLIDKGHPEFKELWNFIYRGVMFALRRKIRTHTIDSGVLTRLIDVHASMYLGGGESAQDDAEVVDRGG